MKGFWRLMRFLFGYKTWVALAMVSNVLTAVFTFLGIPLLIPFLDLLFGKKELTLVAPGSEWSFDNLGAYIDFRLSDLIVQHGKEQALEWVCVLIVVVFFLKNLFRYLALFFMAPVRNGIVRDLRKQLFEKILILPLGYFSDEKKGDILTRMTADVQEVESSILNMLEIVFREPLIIAGSLGFMLYVSPSLTGFVFMLIVFTAVVIGGLGRNLKRSSGKVQHQLGVLGAMVDEALGGLRIIKGFNAERYQKNKFGEANNKYRRMLTRMLWRRELASPLSEFLGIAVVSLLLWFGSRQVFTGDMQASTFITFIFAFYNVIDPAKSFSKAYYNIQRGLAALQRVEVILDAKESIMDPTNPLPSPAFQHQIEYREVTFTYRQEEGPVLQHICLSIPKGKSVALVGASGAGKSTLADLLPRFYDVQQGGIYIDGQNIKNFRLHDLRQLMGIVSQEAILFNDSIYNNIVFGIENVRAQDVENAARIANAHDFIMATELGYDTNIGDRGNKLSGGQRQRLTIARAILKNPPILILDEATSALDSESEKLVQAALLELMKNRTSIVIAHRLSTVQHADEIVVMRAGRIVEQGTHQELLQLAGDYKKLVEMQQVFQ